VCWVLVVGCWVLGVGCWVLGVGRGGSHPRGGEGGGGGSCVGVGRLLLLDLDLVLVLPLASALAFLSLGLSPGLSYDLSRSDVAGDVLTISLLLTNDARVPRSCVACAMELGRTVRVGAQEPLSAQQRHPLVEAHAPFGA
jgi:hypothetical protein